IRPPAPADEAVTFTADLKPTPPAPPRPEEEPMTTPNPATAVAFGGFDQSVADEVGEMAHTAMDLTEAVLQMAGLDRENPDDRRKALEVALQLRPDLDPGEGDRDAIVNDFASTKGGKMSESLTLEAQVGALAFTEGRNLGDWAVRRATFVEVAKKRPHTY